MSARGPRYEAQQRGDKHYLSDKLCGRGHNALRITATGTCTACRQEAERARYHASPDKTKEKIKRKYIKNQDVLREKRRQAYAASPDKERSLAIVRSRAWRSENPEHRNALKRKYVAAKQKRVPAWASLPAIVAFYKACPKGFHVDHVIPLRGKLVSGLHTLENLQYLPAVENLRKNNRYEVTA